MSGPVQTVYVSNGRGGTVTPIDTATNTPGPPILIGRGPGQIAITPDGKTAYVTSDESIVVPIDTATNTPGPPIAVGVNRPGLHDQPDGIAITPDGKTVYVANIGSGTVTPIDTATNTPGEPVEVGVRPRAIVITPDGKTAYVVNQSRPQRPPWHSYEAEKRGLPQPRPPGLLDAGPLGADIASFRLHLAAEGKSARTVQGYTSAVRWFAAAWLLGQAGKTSWDQADARDIQQWMVHLLDRYSSAYASIQFRALRQFFKWRAAEG